LKLERANLDPLQAVKTGSVTKVQGDKLVVAAPLKLQRSNTQVAPKAVKAKIDQPKVEKGWANISDPNTKAKLEQKLKTENPKNVPTPSNQPNAAANVNALASPGVSPFEKGKGKHKGEAFQNQAGASIAPGASPGGSKTPFEQGQGKKSKGRRFESEPGASVAPGSSASESFEQGKNKHKGQKFENEPTSAAPGSSPTESFEQGKGKYKGQRLENERGASVAPGSSESFEQGKGKKKGRVENGEQTPVPGRAINPQNPNPNLEKQNNPEGEKRKGNRHDENFQPGSQNVGGAAGGGGKRREQIQPQGPPQGGQYGQPGGQQGGQGKGKGKKGEASPTPSPR